jgi:hypothetical protein
MRTLIKRVLLRDEPCDEIHIAGWVRALILSGKLNVVIFFYT